MKKLLFTLMALSGLIFTSCESDDAPPTVVAIAPNCTDNVQNGDETGVDCGGSCSPCETAVDPEPEEPEIENPATYSFLRGADNTVSFGGQTTRLQMGDEIISAFKTTTKTKAELAAMFTHEEGAMDFEDTELNTSGKNMRSKTAASIDFFASNALGQAEIRADFDGYLAAQVDEVFPNWGVTATPGVAGQIPDGSSTRYVSALGLEYNQLWTKGLIGAMVTDQTLNGYLSPAVLDAGSNTEDNDAGTVAEGKAYTTMEHKWDEAYGYVYGLNADKADPNADLGADSFLNKYILRVEGDDSFTGIADEIFQAFKLGRAAIVATQYDVRDEQAEIIRLKVSEIIGIRAVYYLQTAKSSIDQETPDFGGAFHDISEGYGFIYSLQFTRKPNSTDPYFTKAEVDAFLDKLMGDGDDGLWDVKASTLESIATDIAAGFEFTLEAASE
ncbi:DUF4856 domain-containing protein [Maribacter antarcticus]|uniref:DUF4856 domain-containing protein n=1 Tax=Maribacter antarcticus TaxID=505250 RepID=UPI0004796532|nr:DUF4856 domain-containing protein [Maribacter antarcticus]